MAFVITIEDFEGPLDLMLYLIRDNKMDLFDLDLVKLTHQYVSFIHQAQENNLEIASEYLSEMAGLIELKSKRLLPRPKIEDEFEDDLNDPTSLVARLIEYQRFKDASLDLSRRFIERQYQLNLYNTQYQFESKEEIEVFYQHDIYDLIKAMNKVIARQRQIQMSEIVYTKTEYSIDERIDQIRQYIFKETNKFSIDELFNQHHDLEFKIVTFLAVLDMILMKEINYHVSDDEIYLKGA
ncbi:MAG TPA: segregation/condensation protein A [Erysipelothrix sp.]|nr:segregation/condensation protein A [Erysipelothrix sp.]